jgi:uncharacterized protein (TIGR00730 family)
MKKTTQNKKTTGYTSLPVPRSIDEWKTFWQNHPAAMELPEKASADRKFLTQVRTPKKEMQRLKRVNEEFKRALEALIDTGMGVTVFGSARFDENHPYYQLAREVGQELAKAGFTTLTGGGPGIMEAANRGAFEQGGKSIGMNIKLPYEQVANPYVDQSIEFSYFFARKTCLLKYSCAYIVMPGGLGTLDELFEAATLVQCGKIGPFPVILMGLKFWQGLREWMLTMVDSGVFAKEEIQFAHITDSPQEAVEFIKASLSPDLLPKLPLPPPEPVKKSSKAPRAKKTSVKPAAKAAKKRQGKAPVAATKRTKTPARKKTKTKG